MKRIRLFMALCTAFVGLTFTVPALAVAADNSAQSTACTALGSDATCSKDAHGSVSFNGIITAIINILSFIVGLAAVIMIIVGGFRYVTSGGDSGNITSAKNTIIYAIIGLVVVGSAQGIVWFVLDKIK